MKVFIILLFVATVYCHGGGGGGYGGGGGGYGGGGYGGGYGGGSHGGGYGGGSHGGGYGGGYGGGSHGGGYGGGSHSGGYGGGSHSGGYGGGSHTGGYGGVDHSGGYGGGYDFSQSGHHHGHHSGERQEYHSGERFGSHTTRQQVDTHTNFEGTNGGASSHKTGFGQQELLLEDNHSGTSSGHQVDRHTSGSEDLYSSHTSGHQLDGHTHGDNTNSHVIIPVHTHIHQVSGVPVGNEASSHKTGFEQQELFLEDNHSGTNSGHQVDRHTSDIDITTGQVLYPLDKKIKIISPGPISTHKTTFEQQEQFSLEDNHSGSSSGHQVDRHNSGSEDLYSSHTRGNQVDTHTHGDNTNGHVIIPVHEHIHTYSAVPIDSGASSHKTSFEQQQISLEDNHSGSSSGHQVDRHTGGSEDLFSSHTSGHQVDRHTQVDSTNGYGQKPVTTDHVVEHIHTVSTYPSGRQMERHHHGSTYNNEEVLSSHTNGQQEDSHSHTENTSGYKIIPVVKYIQTVQVVPVRSEESLHKTGYHQHQNSLEDIHSEKVVQTTFEHHGKGTDQGFDQSHNQQSQFEDQSQYVAQSKYVPRKH